MKRLGEASAVARAREGARRHTRRRSMEGGRWHDGRVGAGRVVVEATAPLRAAACCRGRMRNGYARCMCTMSMCAQARFRPSASRVSCIVWRVRKPNSSNSWEHSFQLLPGAAALPTTNLHNLGRPRGVLGPRATDLPCTQITVHSRTRALPHGGDM